MNLNPFEGQLERLARTLTDQFGVSVVCQGEEAWTDGSRIVLPSLPDPMDDGLERMVVGFLDHEMAHVAFSNFDVVTEFSKKNPGYEVMLNVVEDALIERRAMERWPGVRRNLDEMFAQIRDRIKNLVAKREPFGKFCTAVYLKLSHHAEMLGLETLVDGYEDLFDWFPSVVDTAGAAQLAEQILTRWLQQNPQTPAESSDGAEASDDSSQGDQPPARGDSSATPDNETGEDKPVAGSGQLDVTAAEGAEGVDDAEPHAQDDVSDTQCADADDDVDAECKSQESAPDGDSAQTSEAEPTSPDSDGIQCSSGAGGVSSCRSDSLIGEIVAEAITERVASLDSTSKYRAFTKAHDRITPVPSASDHDVRALRDKHADVIRRLRRGLANALRSQEKRWWRDDQLRGTLSPRSLHRLCMDRPRVNVFRTRASVQGMSTAISVLLDASGSMTRRKMEVARDALRVLLEALGDLRVATEALTFTTGRELDLSRAAQKSGQDPTEMRQRFSRFANLEIGIVKQFDESVKTALRRLPSINGTGLTPLGEAMHIAARRLHVRPETRKILLVLTDGRPGCESSDNTAQRHAEHVARQFTGAGIELIGVGIMDESSRAIVADTIVVHQIEELPAQLCKLLSRTLLKGLRHVG